LRGSRIEHAFRLIASREILRTFYRFALLTAADPK
jgi:hypothetical protein